MRTGIHGRTEVAVVTDRQRTHITPGGWLMADDVIVINCGDKNVVLLVPCTA